MSPFPAYFDEGDARRLYLERVGEVHRAAELHRTRHGVKPARDDRFRIAAFGIDVQVCFAHPEGSLFVPGAVEDTQRTVAWLYRNLGNLSSLHLSLDTHEAFQVFHPAWWRDVEGRPPQPFTVIRAADVESGRWRAVREPEASLQYVRELERRGRYVLTIWPFHALEGGIGRALMPTLREAALFHELVRETPTRFISKGEEPLTEMFSVLSPEVDRLGERRLGGFDTALFEALLAHDRVYVFGQARSHCVRSTLEDLLAAIQARDPALARKVWLLEDAMSDVPPPPLTPLPAELDWPAQARAAMERFEAAGMRRVRCADPVVPA